MHTAGLQGEHQCDDHAIITTRDRRSTDLDTSGRNTATRALGRGLTSNAIAHSNTPTAVTTAHLARPEVDPVEPGRATPSR